MVYILKKLPDYLTDLPELPKVALSTHELGISGATFFDLKFPKFGSFDIAFPAACVVWALGPMKIRFGGNSKVFLPEFEHPRLFMPGHSHYGDWLGSSNNLSIDLSQSFVESALHRPLTGLTADQVDRRARQIEYLLRLLRADVAAKAPAGPTLTETIIQCIVCQLWPDDAGSQRLEERSGSPAIMRACDEIEARLSERLTLAELAQTAGLSTRHFTRAFRHSLGCAPHEYIVRRRVERARELIATGELELVDVAEAVGFSSQSHMTVAFRRMLRATPTAFRKSQR